MCSGLEAYIPNLSLLQSLEPSPSLWWVMSKPILVIRLKPKSRLINSLLNVQKSIFDHNDQGTTRLL